MFLSAGVSFAQFGGSAEKTALKNIDNQRWEKAETKLRKALGRHAVNPSIRYVLSVFFFQPENPSFNLDSAYHYAVTALDDYAFSFGRERDRLNRLSVDSLRLTALRAKIDSTAFEVARKANTEVAYLSFLRHFPSSVQRDLAEQLRDEVAFQDAVKENSHESLLDYLNRYPNAQRAPEARTLYELLLYQAHTKDQRLSSYESFLRDHPETPFRKEVNRHIFEISTAEGSAESFLTFTTRYPASDFVKRARQMAFHILAEADKPEWPPHFLNDSLQHLLTVNNTYLVPVLKNNLYGFIDEYGKEVLPPVFKSIDPGYLCGYVTNEILAVNGQLVSRVGSRVYPGPAEEITDMGLGLLKIKSGPVVKVIHKAGFLLHDSIEDARIICNRYTAVKKNAAWRLHTLTGRLLEDRSWDDITAFQDVLVFTRGDKYFITPKDRVSRCAGGTPLELSEPFDDVKPWPENLVWGRSGQYQGVLKPSLDGLVGFDMHSLTKAFFGAIAAVPNGFVLYNWQGKKSGTFGRVKLFGERVAVKKNQSWYLFDPRAQEFVSRGYDSLSAAGPFVLGFLGDTLTVHFDGENTAAFFRPQNVLFIPGKDSTSFLMVQENAREKIVYDLRGRKLFSAAVDALEYAGQGVFVVTRKDKKGLVNMEGEILLSPEFDAIGSAKDEVLSILRNKRFGSYSLKHRKLIKPQYDRNILPYGPALLTTFRDGYYGFLGWDNKPVSAFQFDEIQYWDDSVALVKKGTLWSLYDVASGQTRESNIRKIIMVKDSDQEKIAIVQKENHYGVISNRRKVLIPVTFSDIRNLGSPDEPLYFTEKHIREASLFIVIYYDRDGNMLRKEIYDDATEYDRIYCSDN